MYAVVCCFIIYKRLYMVVGTCSHKTFNRTKWLSHRIIIIFIFFKVIILDSDRNDQKLQIIKCKKYPSLQPLKN